MAELASLALLATPEAMLDPTLEADLLARAGALSIALRRDGARALLLSQRDTRQVETTVDLRTGGALARLGEAIAALVQTQPRMVRLLGMPYPAADSLVEVTFDDTPLLVAMRAYALRILLLSLLISVGTAGLIWLLARRLLVRPLEALIGNMARFRDDPEDAARVMKPSSGVVEVRLAETALGEMQTQVREALRERARLAALGEAVARIAHDLRNMLATTQLLADRLETSRDPAVHRIGPKLIGSLDRAIALCDSTLRYGRAEEAAPVPRRIVLRTLVAEVGDSIMPDDGIRFDNAVAEGFVVEADPDQLFRILTNLVRNAVQAMQAGASGGTVSVAARPAGETVEIDVADTGPGLPTRALENLFKPFRGNVRRGGSGLGLAIAHDLAALQGGRLTLVSTTTEGTVFRIVLPPGANGGNAL
jgi:signal transduction histidine kinase